MSEPSTEEKVYIFLNLAVQDSDLHDDKDIPLEDFGRFIQLLWKRLIPWFEK